MKEKSRRMTLMMKLGGGTALLVVLVTVLCVGAAVMIFTGFLENDARQKAELAVDGYPGTQEVPQRQFPFSG